jgi:hypothetical protein
MNENEIKSLIKLTNFKNHADEVFDNPFNTLDMIQRIAEDYKNCIDYQALLYEQGCFMSNSEYANESRLTDIQIGLYKLILAELPKYL